MQQLAACATELMQFTAVQGQLCRTLHEQDAIRLHLLHEWLVRKMFVSWLIPVEHLAKGQGLAGPCQQSDLMLTEIVGHTTDT